MPKPLKMSATMVAALDDIHLHGGKVERRQGGFWTYPGCPTNGGVPHWYLGTSTVEALVTRGWLRYTQMQKGRRGEFPISAETTTPPADTAVA